MFKYCIILKNKLSCNYNKGDLLMKKIALILTLMFATSMASYAFIDNQYTKTEQYLQNTGYSAEAAKMTRVVSEDPYREVHKDKNTPLELSRKIYNYLVPGMYTDYDYYNHNINFNTTNWRDL